MAACGARENVGELGLAVTGRRACCFNPWRFSPTFANKISPASKPSCRSATPKRSSCAAGGKGKAAEGKAAEGKAAGGKAAGGKAAGGKGVGGQAAGGKGVGGKAAGGKDSSTLSAGLPEPVTSIPVFATGAGAGAGASAGS